MKTRRGTVRARAGPPARAHWPEIDTFVKPLAEILGDRTARPGTLRSLFRDAMAWWMTKRRTPRRNGQE